MTNTPLDVGVLVDGDSVREWQQRVLNVIAHREDVSLSIVVRNDASESTLRAAVDKITADGLWGLVVGVRDSLVDPWFRRSVPLAEVSCLDGVPRVDCTPMDAESFGNELPTDAIESLEAECDLAIRFGFGVLRGAVLDAPDYGVLSFHHGDIREYRGRPAGFWEFYDGRETAGVTLQRLTETLDGGEVVASTTVDIADCRSWTSIQDRLFAQSVPLATDGFDTVLTGESPMEPSHLGEIHTAPTAREIVSVGLETLRRQTKRKQ
ncbi:formyltransferase family protein [Halorientalis regularis]|uniref:Formyl transferase n=1 Tax=Halorientalis regularis TaxID=660518 RepID=A0A1G7HGU4_9EURY|nr:formyltransferase family protein [Halorientalis regularis]SDE99533.1 Formyl transferase [Halorientalis regularis]